MESEKLRSPPSSCDSIYRHPLAVFLFLPFSLSSPFV